MRAIPSEKKRRGAQSEIYSERRLHHTRRARRARRAKYAACLKELTEVRTAAYRRSQSSETCGTSSPSDRCGSRVSGEGHRPIDVREIGPVKKIISLPPELNFALLTKLKVLEKSYVSVEDCRLTKEVSLQAANASRSSRLNEASGIDQYGSSRRIECPWPLIRITGKIRTRIYVPASEVRDSG